jgi:AraC-like DNA-binding protein
MCRFAAQIAAASERMTRVERWLGPTGTEHKGHQHHIPTLIVCLAGVARVSGPLGDLDLQVGEALLIAPGVWHQHLPIRAGCACYGQGFIGTWSDILLTDTSGPWLGRISAIPYRQMMDSALAASDEQAATHIRALLEHVLGESVLPVLSEAGAAWRMMSRLCRGAHLGVSTDDMIRSSGLSRTCACAAFRRAFGITPYQAVLQVRLGLAEGMLAAGIGVGVCASRSGFASRRAFNRAWSREHKQTPQQVALSRQRHRDRSRPDTRRTIPDRGSGHNSWGSPP